MTLIFGIEVIVGETVVLTVYGVYMPYENYSYEQMESYLETLDKLQIMLDTGKNNSPVIIVGDLNTRLPQSPDLNKLWYKSKPFNHRGYVLYNFLIENDLMVTNFNFPQVINYTYQRAIFTHISTMFLHLSTCYPWSRNVLLFMMLLKT